jgi:large subunit ribosomal protein L31
MKTEIHPAYAHDAVVVCTTCGTTFVTGSTVPELRVEVCSHCHPFFTGKQNIVDTAGRVDRYKRLSAKQSATAGVVRSKRQKLQAKEARRTPKAKKEE